MTSKMKTIKQIILNKKNKDDLNMENGDGHINEDNLKITTTSKIIQHKRERSKQLGKFQETCLHGLKKHLHIKLRKFDNVIHCYKVKLEGVLSV